MQPGYFMTPLSLASLLVLAALQAPGPSAAEPPGINGPDGQARQSSGADPGPGAWEKTKQTSGEAWEVTRKASAEAWEATRDGAARAWEKTREVAQSGDDSESEAPAHEAETRAPRP